MSVFANTQHCRHPYGHWLGRLLAGAAASLLVTQVPVTAGSLEGTPLIQYRLGTRAVCHLEQTYGLSYPRTREFLDRIHALKERLNAVVATSSPGMPAIGAEIAALQQEALLANPLLRSNRLLLEGAALSDARFNDRAIVTLAPGRSAATRVDPRDGAQTLMGPVAGGGDFSLPPGDWVLIYRRTEPSAK